MRFRHAIFAATTTAVLAVAAAVPANAADSPFVEQKLTLGSTSVKTTTSPECTEAVSTAIAAGATDVSLDLCARTMKLTVSPASRMTQADLANAKDGLSPAEFAELSASVNAGTLRSKDFRQEQINGTDLEVQYGTYYYDGERAWLKATYRGVRGIHHCVSNYSVGLVVELTDCSDSGSTYQRRIYAKWRFTLVAKEVPVSWIETYALNVTAQGSMWQ